MIQNSHPLKIKNEGTRTLSPLTPIGFQFNPTRWTVIERWLFLSFQSFNAIDKRWTTAPLVIHSFLLLSTNQTTIEYHNPTTMISTNLPFLSTSTSLPPFGLKNHSWYFTAEWLHQRLIHPGPTYRLPKKIYCSPGKKSYRIPKEIYRSPGETSWPTLS